MEVDTGVSMQVEESVVERTALNFPLSTATYLFLQRLGVLPTTSTTLHTAYHSKHLKHEAYTTITSIPLIATADIILLLSVLPTTLLPSDLPYAIPATQSTATTRTNLLNTLARLALEPSLTMEIMRRYKPLNAHLWGRMLEMLGLNDEGEWREGETAAAGEREAVERVYRAMVRVLGAFTNVFP